MVRANRTVSDGSRARSGEWSNVSEGLQAAARAQREYISHLSAAVPSLGLLKTSQTYFADYNEITSYPSLESVSQVQPCCITAVR